MKTVKQWFNTLPEPLKSEALEQSKDNWKFEHSSLSLALVFGFSWSTSPSGQEFWESLQEALLEAEHENQ